MIVGIVGSEGAKFTPETEEKARIIIREIINNAEPWAHVVSGGCHLGGIDIWAIEEARKLGVDVKEHRPANLSWLSGYEPSNMLIAQDSDKVYCLTLKDLPPSYTGMTFPLCYHCGTKDHVKSGGCWTVKYAKKIGKLGEVIVIS